MAIGATTVWRVRAGGSASNGGGYDPGISGAATDYTDQDAAQLSITDGATSGAGVTTLTSAAAGFTSAMVGNCIRISAGTNFQTGYYFITAFNSTSSVTLDRTPTSGGAGSGGTGSIGGAFAKINQFANGGTGTQPTLTTPLAPGHTIYVRGAGTADPTTVDYSQNDGSLQFPSGDVTNGCIRLIGYNGRPLFGSNVIRIFDQPTYWSISNVKFKITGTPTANYQFISGNHHVALISCIFDQAGFDAGMAGAITILRGCWFNNSGSLPGTTTQTIFTPLSYAHVVGNLFTNCIGTNIYIPSSHSGVFANNIFANAAYRGVVLEMLASFQYSTTIMNNTFYNMTGDAIVFIGNAGSTDVVPGPVILNNIIANGSAYGVNVTVGSTAANNRTILSPPDYNDFYLNASGSYNNMSAGPHDLAIDPQFTNAAGGDFSIGTNLRAKAWPSTFGA